MVKLITEILLKRKKYSLLLCWPKIHSRPSKTFKNIEDKCFKTGKAVWKHSTSCHYWTGKLSEFSGEKSTQFTGRTDRDWDIYHPVFWEAFWRVFFTSSSALLHCACVVMVEAHVSSHFTFIEPSSGKTCLLDITCSLNANQFRFEGFPLCQINSL